MPCFTQQNLTAEKRRRQQSAIERLRWSVRDGAVTLKVGKTGGVAIVGWPDSDREGITDLCAYRALANTPEFRRAQLRAEAMSGNKVDPRAIASGLHSHDGGATWGRD